MANVTADRHSAGREVRQQAPYVPDLFTKDELRSFDCRFTSSDRSVHIANAAPVNGILLVMGFVRSDSRHDLYHYVVAPIHISNGRDIAGVGHCRCESTHYHGRPCKHVLKLRNVYERNKTRLEGVFGLPELRTEHGECDSQ